MLNDGKALIETFASVNAKVISETQLYEDIYHDDLPKSFVLIHERLQKHFSSVNVAEEAYQSYIEKHLVPMTQAIVQNHENFTINQCVSVFKAWHPLVTRFELANTLEEA